MYRRDVPQGCTTSEGREEGGCPGGAIAKLVPVQSKRLAHLCGEPEWQGVGRAGGKGVGRMQRRSQAMGALTNGTTCPPPFDEWVMAGVSDHQTKQTTGRWPDAG